MPESPPDSKPIVFRRDAVDFEPFPSLPRIDHQILTTWLDATRIEPISAVQYNVTDRWDLGPRVWPDSIWFRLERGEGRVRVGAGARWRPFGPGDTILISKDTEHHLRAVPGTEIFLTVVHFHAWVYGGINLLDLLGFPFRIPDDGAGLLQRTNEDIAREDTLRAPGWRGAMETGIRQVLLHILRYHGGRCRPPAASNALPRLLPVLEWIDRHLADPDLNIPQLAEQIFVCESRLRRLFKRVVGVRPIQFIRRRRVERAGALLATTDMSVEQVATECGFRDVPYFHRVFKTLTGMRPGQYRHTERL